MFWKPRAEARRMSKPYVNLWRQRSAAQRSRDPAEAAHSEMNSFFPRTCACWDGYESLGAESQARMDASIDFSQSPFGESAVFLGI